MEKTPISFKVPTEMLNRLKKASTGQYAPKMADILRRGVELALKELELKNKR